MKPVKIEPIDDQVVTILPMDDPPVIKTELEWKRILPKTEPETVFVQNDQPARIFVKQKYISKTKFVGPIQPSKFQPPDRKDECFLCKAEFPTGKERCNFL